MTVDQILARELEDVARAHAGAGDSDAGAQRGSGVAGGGVAAAGRPVLRPRSRRSASRCARKAVTLESRARPFAMAYVVIAVLAIFALREAIV